MNLLMESYVLIVPTLNMVPLESTSITSDRRTRHRPSTRRRRRPVPLSRLVCIVLLVVHSCESTSLPGWRTHHELTTEGYGDSDQHHEHHHQHHEHHHQHSLDDDTLAQLHPSTHVYTNQFVAQVNDEPARVRRLAQQHGFNYLGHIFDNYHHLEHRRISKRSIESGQHDSLERLASHPSVDSLQQQKLRRRTKRDYVVLSPGQPSSISQGGGPGGLPHYSSAHFRHYQNANPPLLPFAKNGLDSLPLSSSLAPNESRFEFDDPQWPKMWYLNRRTKGAGFDMNVEQAWAKNYTGRGVVVTILDDGLEKDHPDLYNNYDSQASCDINGLDNDPMPRYDIIDSNRHGTRCAGEVAANANNSVCGVGVAFNARVGGIRMLDGDVTDAVEARSLSFNIDHIHIYSASWGPDDDGRTVDGPGEMAAKAFKNGIEKGRKGKGSIFVWASGNGGREKDNCNCDGYTNSIYTLSISSATEKGAVPWYSEACPSTLAATYSSGSFGEKQIITTDLHHGCTATHTGTSASAPLAAGICALALEANPELTWRDMQHIVIQSAKRRNLAGEWRLNGVGRNVSHWFGYGLIDASAMVDLAKNWTTVPEQRLCKSRLIMPDKNGKLKTYTVLKHSKMEIELKVNCSLVSKLEHVQAKINMTSNKRGDLEIRLVSPAGTTSILLDVRPMDSSRMGFAEWPFMTVHNWGESPNGVWKLVVINRGSGNTNATLTGWELMLYGTGETHRNQSSIGQLGHHEERSRLQSSPLNENKSPMESNSNEKDFNIVWTAGSIFISMILMLAVVAFFRWAKIHFLHRSSKKNPKTDSQEAMILNLKT